MIQDFKFGGFYENLYISSNGTITSMYQVSLPPIFSLSKNLLENISDKFKRALNSFSFDREVYIQKQDIFLKKEYIQEFGNTFLQQSMKYRFNGEEEIQHSVIIAFTTTLDLSVKNNKELFLLEKFTKQIDLFLSILKELPSVVFKEMEQEEILSYLLSYHTFFSNNIVKRDVYTEKELLTDGKSFVGAYAINSIADLPNEIEVFKRASIQQKSNSEFELLTFTMEDVGITLNRNHILNQVWKINKANKERLGKTLERAKKYETFSNELRQTVQELREVNDDILLSNNIMLEFNYSIILLENNTEDLTDAMLEVEDILSSKRIIPYQPMGQGLYNLYFSNQIGNINNLHPDYYFFTDSETTLSLLNISSNYKEDIEGIYFNNRLNNLPMKIDLWNAPFGAKIKARNGIIVSSTGGGKSVLALNILQQYKELGYKIIIVEFGKSFYSLAKLYNETSLHIDYDKDSKIGFNPFNVKEATEEEIRTIAEFLIRLLQIQVIDENATLSLLALIIKDYLEEEKVRNFSTFYRYVEDNSLALLTKYKDNIGKYFDIDRFLLVGKNFLKGGLYENLTSDTNNVLDEITTKDLVVIELTKIKEDAFLTNMVMFLIGNIIDKVLMNRNKRSYIFFDEYAETQNLSSNEKDSIHATVSYCYQKLRKENSAVYVALQDIAQLRKDNYTASILSQADLLFVPETNKIVYENVIETFKIKDADMISQLYSMCSHFDKENLKESYSEIFIKVGDSTSKVVRIALSKEKFLTFQTDGDLWNELHSIGNKPFQEVIENKANSME